MLSRLRHRFVRKRALERDPLRPSERHRIFAKLYWLQRVWEPLGVWRHRRAVCGGATGRTLEIGVGTGFSLPYYRIERLTACDPSIHMLHAARKHAERMRLALTVVAARAEALPFVSGSFDSVTSCLTFCTIPDRESAAAEVERVLGSKGQFRFVEHGISERRALATLQRTITPAWRKLFGGCHLDRVPAPPIGSLELTKIRRCSAGTVARGTAKKTAEETTVATGEPITETATG